jgi:Mce-associated membrane protein
LNVAEPDDTANQDEPGGADPGAVAGGAPGDPVVGTPPARRSGGYLAVLVGLTVVTIALVVFGVILGLRVLQDDAQQARRETVLQTARQFAAELTTIEYRTVDRDVQVLLDGSTEQFAEQFGFNGPAFADVAKQTQLVSTGEVTAAGVERVDAKSARVLVAVRATVRDVEVPEGTPRNYRLGVELVWTSDRWLVSNVEFIL